MRIFLKLALILLATGATFGCAHNYYNIPQETLEKRVKTIGVAPFFVDAESDIRHPEKGAIVALIEGANAKSQKELIVRLRETGIFYIVRPVDGDPARLSASVVSSRELRDDAGIIYNKYFYKKDKLRQLLTENGLDAMLFVTVSGLNRQGKVFSSNFLSYLETDYNFLAVSAQLLDRDGTIIWEYPNFRRSALSYPMVLQLQYPDFDEAAANLTDKVEVKFKTVAGVKKAFAQSESSVAANAPQVSTLYARQFDEMLALLKPYKPLWGGKTEQNGPAPVAEPDPVVEQKPVAAPKTIAPPVYQRPTAPPAVTAPKSPITQGTFPSGDIVPEEPPVK